MAINLAGAKHYPIIVMGLGVSGAADVNFFSNYTNAKKILGIEKHPWTGMENSNPMYNAQTLHNGSRETNYNLAKALKVKRGADMIKQYCEQNGDPLLFQKRRGMVLGVGTDEVAMLKARMGKFAPYYPDLKWAGPKELERLELLVMAGRDPNEVVGSLYNSEGLIVNYQRLAEHLLADALKINPKLELSFNTQVKSLKRQGDLYIIETEKQVFTTEFLVCTSGAYSLFFAQELGYGLDYGILPVAGDFYSWRPSNGREGLGSKVYRVQIEGRPFAEVHGDPDILDMTVTRFGPTVKPMPLMERHRYGTMPDFGKISLRSPIRMAWSLYKILTENDMLAYVMQQQMFSLPVIGKAAFLKEVQKIVPTARYSELQLRRNAGGIRPQVVDLKTRKMLMGNVRIEGFNSLFNTTPSPGASASFSNGEYDVRKIVDFSNGTFIFNEEKFRQDFNLN